MEKKNLDFYTVEPCASSNAYEINFRNRKINLENAQDICEVLAKTPVVIVCKFENVALSIYASGRIMVKGTNKSGADSLSKKIVDKLEKAGALV